MTTLKTVAKAPGLSYKMLPYRKGDVDYGSLKFSPDLLDVPPDHMEQSREIREVLNLLSARFTDFDRSPDVFLDADTNICYNPRDLNVRVAPDVYLVFGVDAEAIHPRKIYLPWEAGKVPDWVLEVASESTGQQDVNRKPNIYAQIGIPEYWMFDPTGGRYHRQRINGGGFHPQPLYGGRLVDGRYQPIELTTEPDGILKGYSEILELSLAWDEGWPRFYDPATGAYLANWRQEREMLRAEREAMQAALESRELERAVDQERIRQLEADLRRLRS